MKLNFELIYTKLEKEFVVFINHESYFAIITKSGLFRANTAYPQNGIDYENNTGVDYRPRVVGVDEI